jgi:hypothetical protein
MVNKDKIAELDIRIAKVTRLTQEQVFWTRLEMGCEFLQEWIGSENEKQIRDMEATPEFWSWWLQVWHLIDLRFLGFYEKHASESYIDEYRKHYRDMHHARNVNMRPNSHIMASYRKRIKDLTRSKKTV